MTFQIQKLLRGGRTTAILEERNYIANLPMRSGTLYFSMGTSDPTCPNVMNT